MPLSLSKNQSYRVRLPQPDKGGYPCIPTGKATTAELIEGAVVTCLGFHEILGSEVATLLVDGDEVLVNSTGVLEVLVPIYISKKRWAT